MKVLPIWIDGSTLIKNKISKVVLPENRVSRLKRLINSKDIVRIIESHNSLTGLIIENLSVNKKNKMFRLHKKSSHCVYDHFLLSNLLQLVDCLLVY